MHAFLTVRFALFSSVFAIGGCGQASTYGAHNMPLAQSRTVLQSELNGQSLAGHVNASFQPIPSYEKATAANGGYALTLESFSDGKMCVSTETKGEYEQGTKGKEESREAFEAAWALESLVFGARKSFDDLTEDSLWPDHATTSIHSAKLTETDRKVVEDLFGKRRPGFRVSFHVELCGDAPRTDAETRFLTITRMPTAAQKSAPSLFVWIVDQDGTSPPKKPATTNGNTPSPSASTN